MYHALRQITAAGALALALAMPVWAEEDAVEGAAETGTADEIQQTLSTMVLVPETTPNCYSARNCRGKILSHRDAHNCKRTGGKSWRSSNGQCYNL